MIQPHLRRLAVVGSIAGALALAACGTGGSSNTNSGGSSGSVKGGPGVNVAKKTITIGNIGAISGPAGPLGIPALAGAKAAVAQINAKGGIDGWKLKILFKDAAYVPQNQVQAYNAINSKIAILQSFGSPTTQAIQKQLDQAKLVTLPLSWDSLWDTDPILAPVGTPYALDIANGLNYLINTKHLGNKVGYIYQDDAYGQDGLKGAQAVAKAHGIDLVATASEALTDTDFTSQVQKMKAAGADIVVVTALPNATGPIVGTAASLGYSPTYLLQGPAWLEALITSNGALGSKSTPIAAALAKSTYVMSFATPWGAKVPGEKAMLAAYKKYAKGTIPSIYFTWAYAQTKVAAAILKKAIQDGDLSRAGIASARLHVGKINTGGLTPSVDFTPKLGPPSTGSIINTINSHVIGFLSPVATGVSSSVDSSLEKH
jgi:ABC-type branched-subunit amino acid transport system substrate-binding protein